MAIWSRLLDSRRRKEKAEQEVSSSSLHVSALCSDYENLFAQVTPLADEMLTVEVFGVGRNGARLPLSRTPELAVLNTPNDKMGRQEFLKQCFLTWLSERELNIHAHMNGSTVYGYSILPAGCRTRLGNGENEFYISTKGGSAIETLTDAEVMTLRFTRSPRNLDKGVSPATAAHYWAQIDDLVAQYQKAFFENGAVPATITFITASTREKYETKRKELESGLKGAKNRNKTVYAWRQYLSNGDEKDEIEVKTIQGNNSTLALKDIISIVTDKLNMNFGVSNFILGNDSSAKYDNAELSDHQFTKRRVFPALVMFWGEFQHELDRITGGLGYAIDFELEIPELTDRARTQAETRRISAEALRTNAERDRIREEIERVKEETRRVEAETAKVREESRGVKINQLLQLVNAGADPVTACAAVGLVGSDWEQIANGLKPASTTTFFSNEPAPKATHDAAPEEQTDEDEAPVFEEEDIGAKETYEELLALALVLVAMAKANPQQFLNRTPEQIIAEVSDRKTADRIFAALRIAAEDGANVGAVQIAKTASVDVAKEITAQIADGGFALTESFLERLRNRVDDFTAKYESDTATALQTAINDAFINGTTQAELRKTLDDIVPASRAELIARTESHAAINAGRFDNDKSLAEKYGLKIQVRWDAAPGACPVCAALDGKVVGLGEAFPSEVMTPDGIEAHFAHSVYNNDGREPNAHPRCRCTFSEEVVA